MAYVTVETKAGPKPVHVCDYCRCVCIPHPQRFCSGRCAREYYNRARVIAIAASAATTGETRPAAAIRAASLSAPGTGEGK